MTPHTIQEVEDLVLKEFELNFPHLSDEKITATPNNEKDEMPAKFLTAYMRSEATRLKDHIRQALHKIAAQTLSAVTPEEEHGKKFRDDERLEHYTDGYWECRQEVLRRGKEFLQVPPNDVK